MREDGMEEWRDIVGYEGLYQVSNMGQVKSLNGRHRTENLIKPHVNNNGYYLCDLYKDNKRRNMLLHRLVASAFIPNPNNLPFVNHKDSVRTNCCSDNLEWCDRSYNTRYSYQHNNRRKKVNWSSGERHYLSKPVIQFDKDGNKIKRYCSISEAERCTGINNSGICAALAGRYKTAGGVFMEV